MEANVSDELIEAMARAIYESQFVDEWSGGDGIEAEQFRQCARAVIPIIRAHLEPTSEMVEAALAKGKAANLEPPLLELMRKGLLANWRDMLAASPIGDVG